jgi:hypothetical protein
MKNRLKDSKSIIIRTLNLESLEIASRLKEKFPKKKILILDPEKQTSLHKSLGNHVASELIKYSREKGIYFNLGRVITGLSEKEDGRVRIELDKKKNLNRVLISDMVIDADNLVVANSKLLKTE